jgi:hypothetical protein
VQPPRLNSVFELKGAYPPTISSWLIFWDNPHSIYVNAQHKEVHFRQIAQEIAALVFGPNASFLDHGSGEALHADIIAAAAGDLLLCEGAPSVRAGLEELHGTNPKIRVLCTARCCSAARALAWCYWLALRRAISHGPGCWRTFRNVSSIIENRRITRRQRRYSPDVGPTSDACALLRFAVANGFLLAALGGLLRTFFSDYRQLRSRVGLSRYSEDAMLQKLGLAGYSANRVAVNIGHNQSRMAFHARPLAHGKKRD